MLQQLVVMMPAIPLLMAIITNIFSKQLHKQVARLSVLSLLATFIISLFLLYSEIADKQIFTVSYSESWGMLLYDPLSTLMSSVISGISLVVHIYSVRYMADEEGYTRFFVLLGLMTSSLLFMVAAGDLVVLIISWHLIGVFLYFLLGHDTRNPASQRYAMWTLITYRFGDLPLVLAAALLFKAYGTWTLLDLFRLISENPDVKTIAGLPVVEVSGILIGLSAFARSAQFLLHSWLPYTMSGPTPVSALMHAGIVNAGGFLINRFAPLYMQTHDVLHLMFIVGLITAVIGSMLMLTQSDIKKALGYSTMGQMGFMIMECGVGAFSLAVFHLIAHGLFKGTLFLGAGGVIGEARKSDGVPKNELYTFVLERQAKRKKQPWLVMAAVTLVMPLIILVAAHWLVEQDYFQKQGAIVLLFFGWVTGAQLVFSAYKMQTTNPWRLFTMIIATFAIVVVGYVVISHGFNVFLYPDPNASDLLYVAAGIELVWFELFVLVVTLALIFGWLLVYYSDRTAKGLQIKKSIWLSFYALLSREFLIIDIYSWFSKRIFAFAQKLNSLLRWS